MQMRKLLALAGAIALASAASAQSQTWSPDPWIADLAQMRAAMESKYANLEWLREEREVPLDAMFDRVAARLRTARSDAEARAVFDRLVQRIGDGHVAIEWPRGPALSQPAAPPTAPAPTDICRAMGYEARQASGAYLDRLTGYRALPDDGILPAGLVPVEGRTVGVVRIGYFDPRGSLALCRGALAALKIPADAPCDDACRDKVLTWTFHRFTAVLEERARELEAAGAVALLVDITGNGGGSDWTEAAARIVSPRPLKSAPVGFVRGAHWAKQWSDLATTLRDAARSAKPADRSRLLAWAAQADKARADATCTDCPRIGRAGFATGLVGDARAADFEGKPWAVHVFNVAQFPYHDSVWKRPLMVLVDNETWSAAEQFGAMLQDNRAAVIVGARTGGAGCGYTWGGTPTTLANSRAVLKLPDCVRYRADGSNEVSGVVPDVLTGVRNSDGAARKARMTEAALPAALREAEARLKR